MSEFRLSPDAEQDLSEMYRHGFWQFGERQADKFYDQLFDSLELLASFPQSGRSAEHIYPELRRIEHNPYVIFYLPRDYGEKHVPKDVVTFIKEKHLFGFSG